MKYLANELIVFTVSMLAVLIIMGHYEAWPSYSFAAETALLLRVWFVVTASLATFVTGKVKL